MTQASEAEDDSAGSALPACSGRSRRRAARRRPGPNVRAVQVTGCRADQRRHGTGRWSPRGWVLHRVLAGVPLEVTLPAPRPVEPPRTVEGLNVLFEDDDIVVVDKPTGVAAHPTPGSNGATVVGGLLASGHTIATSGAAGRQGIVHRLDANTTGSMVVAKSESAHSALKRAFRERQVEKRYHAVVQGHPDPLRGTIDAPMGGIRRRGSPSSPGDVPASRTMTPWRPSAVPAWSTSGWRLAERTRSASTCPRSGTRAWAICSTARTRCKRNIGACAASGCTPSAWLSSTRPTAAGSSSGATTPPTLLTRWMSSASKTKRRNEGH